MQRVLDMLRGKPDVVRDFALVDGDRARELFVAAAAQWNDFPLSPDHKVILLFGARISSSSPGFTATVQSGG